jgi:hypothetical protein
MLTHMEEQIAQQHDGSWAELDQKTVPPDDVERLHRYRDSVVREKPSQAKGCRAKPLNREGTVFWRPPNAKAGKNGLAEVIELKSQRQAEALKQRAIQRGAS